MRSWERRKDLLCLRFVRGAIRRELQAIADEKSSFKDGNHKDSDCGFQLLAEIYGERYCEQRLGVVRKQA